MHKSLPSFIPALVAQEHGLDIDGFSFNGFCFDGATEVSLDSLNEFSQSFADECVSYWSLCQDFWDAVSQERASGQNALVTSRELGVYRLVDRKTERSYLVEQYDELRNTPLVEALQLATATLVDIDELKSLNSVRDAYIKEGSLVVVLEYKGRKTWSNALGGVPGRGEIGRFFTIKVSHAKWRDSRVKRLLEVSVQAMEVLPEFPK